MVDRFRILTGFPRFQVRNASLFPVPIVAVALFVGIQSGSAQTPSAASYPSSSSTAAAGMTSGIPGTSGYEQAQMAQIRTAAQNAQGQAVAASMARSADQALENQHNNRALQDAREIKFLKRDMAERMKWERSNHAQINKVTSNDMSSWQTSTGNVKVERDVPDPFLQAMIAMEGQEKPKQKERKGFSGLNPFKKEAPNPTAELEMVTRPLPGLTTPAPTAPAASSRSTAPSSSSVSSSYSDTGSEGQGGGFFSGFRMPKIGNKADTSSVEQVYDAEPEFVGNSRTSSASASSNQPSAPSASPAQANTVVPARSGQSLINGTAESVGTVSVNDEAPAEKKGFFSGFKKSIRGTSSSSSVTNSSMLSTPFSSGGGGFFGFGKKKADNSIDARLFPENAVSQTPTGSDLGGGYTVEDVAEDASFAPSSTGDIVMPGETAKRGGGFNLSMPTISMPTVSLSGKNKSGSNGGGNVPTLTTINSSGTDYYVVTSTAQFIVYGNDPMSSEVKALSSGTVVRMTKPGEQWASVRLPDGLEGVLQNKFLRAASAAESGGQFAASGGE